MINISIEFKPIKDMIAITFLIITSGVVGYGVCWLRNNIKNNK